MSNQPNWFFRGKHNKAERLTTTRIYSDISILLSQGGRCRKLPSNTHTEEKMAGYGGNQYKTKNPKYMQRKHAVQMLGISDGQFSALCRVLSVQKVTTGIYTVLEIQRMHRELEGKVYGRVINWELVGK